MLIKNYADVNAKNYRGFTALMFASARYEEIVKLLLNANADVNAKDNQGCTALMTSDFYKKYDISLLLRINGAETYQFKSKDLDFCATS